MIVPPTIERLREMSAAPCPYWHNHTNPLATPASQESSTMIQPTIGRVVWFHEAFVPDTNEQAQAAIVTYVHGDRCVNLAVFDANGNSAGRTSVPLRQPGDVAPSGPFCEWMPYQIGQAKAQQA